jgi:hypothetical protein
MAHASEKTLLCLACFLQFNVLLLQRVLYSLSVGDVADRTRDEQALISLNGLRLISTGNSVPFL